MRSILEIAIQIATLAYYLLKIIKALHHSLWNDDDPPTPHC